MLALQELRALGARGARVVDGGVAFRSSRELLYAVNLESRLCSRAVVRIAEFDATSFPELERRLRRVNWGRWIGSGNPARVRVTCRKSRLYHSDAVAERVVRMLEQEVGAPSATEEGDDENESVDGPVAPQLLLVRMFRDRCTVSLDSSGPLLHMRGYRLAIAKAPLRETLAAALVVATVSDQHEAIIDPMCGSGTIVIEAAFCDRRIPPGLRRGFAFERWPDFDSGVWARVRSTAEGRMHPAAQRTIVGADRDAGAIAAAQQNAMRAGVDRDVALERRPLSALEPPPGVKRGLIIANPPYGVRVGERDALRDLYARFGDVLRGRFGGWTVALLSADRRLEGQLRIALTERLAFSNGGIRVRLLVGEL